MSDTSQGTGWWQASDLKWYPPELYPTDWQPIDDAADPADDGSVGDGAAGGIAHDTADAIATDIADDTAAAVEQPTVMAPVVLAEPAPIAVPSDPVFERPAPDVAPAAQHQAEVAEMPPAAEPIAPPDINWSMPPAGAPLPGEAAVAQPASEPTSVIDWTSPSAEQLPVDPAPAPATWHAPADPATTEPTLVEGIAPIRVDPTRVQPAVAHAAIDPTAPQAPPATWDQAPAQPFNATAASALGEPAPRSGEAEMPAGILGLIGAAALIAGSFFAWAKAGGTLTSGTVNGLTGSNGWGTLICGLIVASLAAALLVGDRKPWVGGAMVVAAVVAVGLAVFSIVDINSTSDDLPGVLRAENVSASVADGAVLDLDIGIWIVTAGGVVAVIAGVLALMRRDVTKS